MILTDLLQVFYAPQKAFKKVLENPKYLGAAIVLILFTVVQTGVYYSVYSRQYSEISYPTAAQVGAFTQSASLWTANSGTVVTSNFDDFINGTNYGNSSLQFSLSNSNNLSLELNLNGTVNCGTKGFNSLSIQAKQVNPQTAPQNVTLYLYSKNSSDYFSRDLTLEFPTSLVNVWNNVTVPVGTADWQTSGNPDWENITRLKMDFVFAPTEDILFRIDAPFFRGSYGTLIDVLGLNFYVFFGETSILQYAVQWLLITGLIYLVVKILQGSKAKPQDSSALETEIQRSITWRPLMVAIGYAMIVVLIEALIVFIASSTLPIVHVPIEYQNQLAGFTTIEITNYNAALANVVLVSNIMQYITLIWLIYLSTMVVRLMTGLTWLKSMVASAAGCAITVLFLLPIIIRLLTQF